MKKYKELVKDYAGTIARIKDLEHRVAQARQCLDQMKPGDPDFVDQAELHSYLSEELLEETEHLKVAINDEYMAVPYQRRRLEGVAAFYREAGLSY